MCRGSVRAPGGVPGIAFRDPVRAWRRSLRVARWAWTPITAALALGACVQALVPGTYEPPYQVVRLNADEARDHLGAALVPECQRLAREGATPTGEARVTVEVAQNGEVLKSRLTQRTGDARIDELFGTTAARMKFDGNGARPATFTGRMRMGYSCAGSTAVGTIELF